MAVVHQILSRVFLFATQIAQSVVWSFGGGNGDPDALRAADSEKPRGTGTGGLDGGTDRGSR